jgi:DHA1 family bicyclomycin/chloramphenicol resistance-like MFS transporter
MGAIGPLSINIIVPAIPRLALDLAADPGLIQLTVSLFFAGLAGAQLLLGPLADRFGRRPVLLTGLIITALTSLAAAAAASATTLVVARTAQAFGAATGIVIARAIVRDLYARDRAASMLGWVTMSVIAVPMFAPLIGGVLETWWGWRAIFLFLAAVSGAVFLWALIALPETRRSDQETGSAARLWREGRALIATPEFVGYVLCAGLMSGPFFTIVGGSAHVVITLMGRSATELGLWLVLSSGGYMFGNALAGRFSVLYGSYAMMWWGLWIQIVGTLVATILLALVPELGPAVIFLPLFFVFVGNGIALPSVIAGAVSVRPDAAGTAAGVTGFGQMGLGAVISQAIAYPLTDAATGDPLTLSMCVEGALTFLAFWFLVRPARASTA